MNCRKHPSFRCHLRSQGKWHTRVPRDRPWCTHYRGDLAKQRGTDTPKYSHQIKIECNGTLMKSHNQLCKNNLFLQTPFAFSNVGYIIANFFKNEGLTFDFNNL